MSHRIRTICLPDFSSDDVRVQLAVTSEKYEAAVTWIREASRTG